MNPQVSEGTPISLPESNVRHVDAENIAENNGRETGASACLVCFRLHQSCRSKTPESNRHDKIRRNPILTAANRIEEKTDQRTGSNALPRGCLPALPLNYRPVKWSEPESNRRPGVYKTK